MHQILRATMTRSDGLAKERAQCLLSGRICQPPHLLLEHLPNDWNATDVFGPTHHVFMVRQIFNVPKSRSFFPQRKPNVAPVCLKKGQGQVECRFGTLASCSLRRRIVEGFAEWPRLDITAQSKPEVLRRSLLLTIRSLSWSLTFNIAWTSRHSTSPCVCYML